MAKGNSVAYIGLGSNLQGPKRQIIKALRSLKAAKGLQLQACSSLYLTEPVGYLDQPVFFNAVARFKTQFSAIVFLKLLQSIENRQQRVRTENQNSARTLDLDILLFGTEVHKTQKLTIPHPRITQRRFVLEPLVELNPKVIIPGYGHAAHFLDQVSSQGCKQLGPILLS